MGKLLSSPLKLNIQEALFSISSAWEPVKGEADGRAWGGLVGRAWWVTFSEGSQGQGGTVRGVPEEACVCSLFLQCSGSRFAKGRLSLGAVRGCFISASPWADGGEKEGEALGPEETNRSCRTRAELQEGEGFRLLDSFLSLQNVLGMEVPGREVQEGM